MLKVKEVLDNSLSENVKSNKSMLHSMFKSIYIVTIMLSFILTLTSCEKEKDSIEYLSFVEKTAEGINTFNFSSPEEMYNELENILSITSTEEMTSYEKNRGYSSIGRLSDEFYEDIDEDAFSSEVEFEKFVQENDHYLTVVNDVDGGNIVLPIYSKNLYRYFAGANGMFRVGNKIFKVFETGNVVANISYLEELSLLTENDLLQLPPEGTLRYYPCAEYVFAVDDERPPLPSSDLHDHCYDMLAGSGFGTSVTQGNRKIEVVVRMSEYPVMTSIPIEEKALMYYIDIYTYKKRLFGNFWKMKNYEIYGSINITGHCTTDGGNSWEDFIVSETLNGVTGKPWRGSIFHTIQPLDSNLYRVHFTSIYISASTEEVGPAIIDVTY